MKFIFFCFLNIRKSSLLRNDVWQFYIIKTFTTLRMASQDKVSFLKTIENEDKKVNVHFFSHTVYALYFYFCLTNFKTFEQLFRNMFPYLLTICCTKSLETKFVGIGILIGLGVCLHASCYENFWHTKLFSCYIL